MIPALETFDKKLDQSHAVMEDLLPGFVVDALMSNIQQPVNELKPHAIPLSSERLIK